jgi:regulator of replication initiation timing
MKESTKSTIFLVLFLLFCIFVALFLPNKTTLDTAQAKFNKTAEQVKLYVDKKTKDAVESAKLNNYMALDVARLQDQMGSLIKSHRELLEKVDGLVTENGQLKIYIANLERQAHNASITDKGVAEVLQAHFAEYEKYKTSTDILLKSLGTEVGLLDKEVDDLATKEHSVLTKQTIVKNYYYHRRCCR